MGGAGCAVGSGRGAVGAWRKRAARLSAGGRRRMAWPTLRRPPLCRFSSRDGSRSALAASRAFTSRPLPAWQATSRDQLWNTSRHLLFSKQGHGRYSKANRFALRTQLVIIDSTLLTRIYCQQSLHLQAPACMAGHIEGSAVEHIQTSVVHKARPWPILISRPFLIAHTARDR